MSLSAATSRNVCQKRIEKVLYPKKFSILPPWQSRESEVKEIQNLFGYCTFSILSCHKFLDVAAGNDLAPVISSQNKNEATAAKLNKQKNSYFSL
jgi:hypothetical protein